MNETLQKILEIDLRHNELLDRLADLDARISAVLEEWTSGSGEGRGAREEGRGAKDE
ncbi:MAG: hypothetical protein FWC43_03625 [Planctomycetaceae bacterium]|nr:hypothetical protein [Planctomycetaceae bacterium]